MYSIWRLEVYTDHTEISRELKQTDMQSIKEFKLP